jgi:hypothetical protein
MTKILNSCWTEENIKRLQEWWEVEGALAKDISRRFMEMGHNITRNAVIGKVHRLKFMQPEDKMSKLNSHLAKRISRERAEIGPRRPPVKSPSNNRFERKPPQIHVHISRQYIESPGEDCSVLMKDSKDGQCKAIIKYQDGLLENAVYCGKPTPPSITREGRPMKSSWCDHHKSRYFVEAKR